jgi:hypothetical protein
LNGRTYSNSTTNHQNIASAATRQYNQVVSFGMVDRWHLAQPEAHQQNEKHYIREYKALAERLAVARKPALYIGQARTLNDIAHEYFAFFRLTPSQEYHEAYAQATEVSEELKAKVKAQHAEILRRKKART